MGHIASDLSSYISANSTGFTSKFTHVTERDSRAEDLGTSLCAVLIAEACNIGNFAKELVTADENRLCTGFD
jgi:hypothetical protein